MAGFDGTQADLGELMNFSKKLAEDSRAFGTEMSRAISSPPRHLGQGGMKEIGYAVRDVQGNRLQDFNMFWGEALAGSLALTEAAAFIAVTYLGADLATAATMEDVDAAFTA
ncbi:MAG TPA: hypothetical protein VGR21_10375, partial [Cryptosporangiaceae bacterium]|nr:hypothetical protein [Cryptosporangiaceae bacterium]